MSALDLRILLVDDEPDVREVVGNLLEMDGCAVRCATGYNDALEMIKEEEFDLVITDYRMPRMHGIYLLDMIKAEKPGLPVIIITAYVSDQLVAEAKKTGADLVIPKPFTLETLSNGIKKVMRKKRK